MPALSLGSKTCQNPWEFPSERRFGRLGRFAVVRVHLVFPKVFERFYIRIWLCIW